MGNITTSTMGGQAPAGQVRVLQPDGRMLHIEHPLLAIQVMQEHPGHLVIKCGPSSMSSEMIREERYASLTYETMNRMAFKHKVVILRADEELNGSSTYFLLPINSNKQQARFGWNSLFKSLKSSSFDFEHKSDSSSGKRKFSILRRSRSLPRSITSDQQVQGEQPDSRQKLSPSVSFPSTRTGGQSFSKPSVESIGQFRELPPLHQLLHHKRPRKIRRPPPGGWKPILESISEVVDGFANDDDFSGDFYKSQSKCFRRLHSFQSPIAHLRPVTVRVKSFRIYTLNSTSSSL